MDQSQGPDPSGIDAAITGACTARELVRRAGGAAGLAKLGIRPSSSRAEVGAALDQMLRQRVMGTNTKGFDTFVDAMFACGLDKRYRSEFVTQIEDDGNTRTASKRHAQRCGHLPIPRCH